MRIIEALFVLFLGFGLLGFGLGTGIRDAVSNVTSNTTLANGTYWSLENAILQLGTIIGGIVVVFAGVYIAIKRPPEDEFQE